MPSSRAATFTDEIIETHVAPDGTLEASLVGGSAEEVKDAVADFVRCEKDFREVNSRPHAATEPSRHPGMEWWKALQWLALADSRLKDVFCGRDRSPRSIAQYHKYRLKLIDGKRYRTDA